MGGNGVEYLPIGQRRIIQPQFRIGRAPYTQQVTHRHHQPGGQPIQFGTGGRRLEVFHHHRLDSGGADHGQHIA